MSFASPGPVPGNAGSETAARRWDVLAGFPVEPQPERLPQATTAKLKANKLE
jgi:hypothetical protein